MRQLPRFEVNLLRILHFFLQRMHIDQALPLIRERCATPPCLTRPGVELVQDSLAKGCMLLLARKGGWRKERHLRGEKIAEGRLWERTPPQELGLVFSGHALHFLISTTAVKPGELKAQWDPPVDELTVADGLLFYLAYAALQDSEVARLFKKQKSFAGNALCRLAYPEDFGDNPGNPAVDFSPWTTGCGACILEALQPELAKKWQQDERKKGSISDGQRMGRIGTAQQAVLSQFLSAVETAGRQDLARFLLQAAAALLTEDATAALWIGSLESRVGRLADRMEMYQAALAFLRQLEVLQQWERRARGIGYFDEGYGAAQLWKQEWERWNAELLCSRAQAIIRQLDPMNFRSGGQPS